MSSSYDRIEAAFKAHVVPSSGPEVLLVKHFQADWSKMKLLDYKLGISDAKVQPHPEDVKDCMIDFAIYHLRMNQVLDDYQEFLELMLIFLGGTPAR